MLLIASPVATVAATATPPTSPPTSQPAAADKLDPIVPLAEFRATSMAKAIDTLRDMTKVNIVVRWRALKDAGIEPDSPVDLRAAKLPLQRVLELLGDVAGGCSNVPLAAHEERGVVILSTRDDDDLEHTAPLRLYDVRDLIESDMAIRSRIQIGQATTAPTTMPSTEERYEVSLEQLKQVILDTIEPDSWRDAGGTVGSLRDFNGVLIVAQTPAVHEQIKKLLEELRRK
jgi:hypothetical protein